MRVCPLGVVVELWGHDSTHHGSNPGAHIYSVGVSIQSFFKRMDREIIYMLFLQFLMDRDDSSKTDLQEANECSPQNNR
jgi:hypothetical protein